MALLTWWHNPTPGKMPLPCAAQGFGRMLIMLSVKIKFGMAHRLVGVRTSRMCVNPQLVVPRPRQMVMENMALLTLTQILLLFLVMHLPCAANGSGRLTAVVNMPVDLTPLYSGRSRRLATRTRCPPVPVASASSTLCGRGVARNAVLVPCASSASLALAEREGLAADAGRRLEHQSRGVPCLPMSGG